MSCQKRQHNRFSFKRSLTQTNGPPRPAWVGERRNWEGELPYRRMKKRVKYAGSSNPRENPTSCTDIDVYIRLRLAWSPSPIHLLRATVSWQAGVDAATRLDSAVNLAFGPHPTTCASEKTISARGYIPWRRCWSLKTTTPPRREMKLPLGGRPRGAARGRRGGGVEGRPGGALRRHHPGPHAAGLRRPGSGQGAARGRVWTPRC